MIDTHNKTVPFGKHKGERWTRVPVGYLRWVANELQGPAREMAEAELQRRGTAVRTMDVELSGHALDRASQVTEEWKEQGVYTWLSKIASEALVLAEKSEGEEAVLYRGYKLAFKHGNHFPILKTIIKK